MVVAVALWSLELKPGKPESVIPAADLRVTNAALGEELADEASRTSVKLTYQRPGPDEEEEDEEDEEETVTTVLCSLTAGKIEQSTIDLVLEGDEEVLFEVTGKNSVFLTGNFIDQNPAPMPEDDSDDEGYDLNDVSSDVEFDASELDDAELEDDSHRFEEIHDEEPASSKKADSKKRPRESDASEEKPSKAEQKKLNKKLKAEGGKAVAAGEKAEAKDKGEEKKPKGADKEKTKEGPKDGVPTVKSEAKTVAGGVKYQDHKPGSGKAAKAGDMVHVRYVGKLTNGKIFDSNTKGQPFKFRLGKGEVIKGWDVGVAGMQIGGERLITIPPAMAYGKRAQPGIPGNSTLVFEVKLVKIA